jgi:hypothetical protein
MRQRAATGSSPSYSCPPLNASPIRGVRNRPWPPLRPPTVRPSARTLLKRREEGRLVRRAPRQSPSSLYAPRRVASPAGRRGLPLFPASSGCAGPPLQLASHRAHWCSCPVGGKHPMVAAAGADTACVGHGIPGCFVHAGRPMRPLHLVWMCLRVHPLCRLMGFALSLVISRRAVTSPQAAQAARRAVFCCCSFA